MRVTLTSLCFVVVGCVTSSPDIGKVKDVRQRRLAANVSVTNLTESDDAFRTLYDGHPRRVARPAP